MTSNLTNETDLKLVEMFNNGALNAFEELIERYESKIFNLSMRFVKNTEDAEEVLQDVFTTLYRKLSTFEGKSAFSSWIYRITVNSSFMKLRKRKQFNAISLEDLPISVQHDYLENDPLKSAHSDTAVYHREIRDNLELAISKLPEQYREIFVLRDVDGMSNEDVSQILNITVPAVKSRLHRARLLLRKKLLSFYEEIVGRKVSLSECVEIEINGADESLSLKPKAKKIKKPSSYDSARGALHAPLQA